MVTPARILNLALFDDDKCFVEVFVFYCTTLFRLCNRRCLRELKMMKIHNGTACVG